MVKLKFDVQGMTCSSCSAHVEKAVRKLDGINTVTVNLLSNNMIVEFDYFTKQSSNDQLWKTVLDRYWSDFL